MSGARFVKGAPVTICDHPALSPRKEVRGVVWRQLKDGTVVVQFDDTEGYSGDPEALIDVHPSRLKKTDHDKTR